MSFLRCCSSLFSVRSNLKQTHAPAAQSPRVSRVLQTHGWFLSDSAKRQERAVDCMTGGRKLIAAGHMVCTLRVSRAYQRKLNVEAPHPFCRIHCIHSTSLTRSPRSTRSSHTLHAFCPECIPPPDISTSLPTGMPPWLHILQSPMARLSISQPKFAQPKVDSDPIPQVSWKHVVAVVLVIKHLDGLLAGLCLAADRGPMGRGRGRGNGSQLPW